VEIVFPECLVVRAFPSAKKAGRLYIDVVDILGAAGKFSFSSDTMSLADVQSIINKRGSLSGTFETFLYDGKMQFKSDNVVFKPLK